MLPSLRELVSSDAWLEGHLPLASKVQTLRAVVPEGHAHSRNGVEDLETANGLLGVAGIPQTQLTVAHARETGGCDAVMLAHPHGAAVLGSGVAWDFLRSLFLSHIPHAQLLVSAGCDQVCPVGAPRQRLHNVVVLERQLRGARLDIPQLHRVVAGRRGEDVLGSRVKQDVADFPAGQLEAVGHVVVAAMRTSCGRSASPQAQRRRARRHPCAA
jgi:hypothetical protein